MNKTDLAYKGNVVVKLKIKDKIITLEGHNTGLESLKKSFCKFLTGNYSGAEDIPQFLGLRKSVDYGTTWVNCLSDEIPLTGKGYEFSTTIVPNNWIARFTAVINHSALLNDISAEDTAWYRLYLYTVSDNQSAPIDLAFLTVSAEDLAKITPGTQAIIEWTMQLLDYVVDQE